MPFWTMPCMMVPAMMDWPTTVCCQAMRFAVGRERGLQAIRQLRPIPAAVHVVLARPHDLHGLGELPGQLRGLTHEIAGWICAPAEPAAQQHGVDEHLLRRQPDHFGGGGPIGRLHLGPGPDVTAIGAPICGAIERFHGCVRQKGHLIESFQVPGTATAQHRLGVAVVARHERSLHERKLLIFGAQALRVQARVGRRLPFDDQRVASLARGVGIQCDDRDPAAEPHHGDDAANGACHGVVDALRRAAERGWSGDDRAQHTGQAHVQPELCRCR